MCATCWGGTSLLFATGSAAVSLALTSLGGACLGMCMSPIPYAQLAINVSVGTGVQWGGVGVISTLAGCGLACCKDDNGNLTFDRDSLCLEFTAGCVGATSIFTAGTLGNFVLGNPIGILWLPAVAPMVPLGVVSACALATGGPAALFNYCCLEGRI